MNTLPDLGTLWNDDKHGLLMLTRIEPLGSKSPADEPPTGGSPTGTALTSEGYKAWASGTRAHLRQGTSNAQAPAQHYAKLL